MKFLVLSAEKLVVPCVATALFYCSACSGLVHDNGSTVIRGIVSNGRAEPVPNARVDISTAAPISGPDIFCPSCYLDCQKWTTTDDSGHFEIDDVDSRLKFRLVVSAVGHKTAQTGLAAPEVKMREVTLRERPKTVSYQRVVQGVVKNANGIAVQGALVSPVDTIDEQGMRSFSTRGLLPSVTDATGHFEIDLVDGVFGIDIEIAADGFCNRRYVDLTPGDDRRELELLEGARVIGSVERMGLPVCGMTIAVAQTDKGYKGEKFFMKAIPTVTDAHGRFELKHLLPNLEYCVYSVIGEAERSGSDAIVETQKFIAPASGETLDIGRLTTVPSVSFSGQLVLSDDRPSENLLLLFKRDPAWDLIKEVPVANDGSFHIDGLPPEVYEISLSSKQFDLDADRIDSLLWTKKSLKRLIDKPVADFELAIRPIEQGVPDLEPNGTQKLAGRVTMTGGEGVGEIRVSADDSVEALGKGLGNGNAPWTSTAKDGSFELTELPDTRVWLEIHRPDPVDTKRKLYLGMVNPRLNDKDITIHLGPETRYELGTLSGRAQ